MKFNEQVTRIEPSPLRAFNDMAHKEGAELFLTLGEPDFHTPQQVKDACGVALENNKTFYAPHYGRGGASQGNFRFRKTTQRSGLRRKRNYDNYGQHGSHKERALWPLSTRATRS